MATSQYIQIQNSILIEYIYTDIVTPEEYTIPELPIEVLSNNYTSEKQFFTRYDKIDDNINVRDISVAPVNINKTEYVFLNRDLPLNYIDYDSNFTSSSNLEPDFFPGYSVKYDTIKIHLTTSFTFDVYDGYIFNFYATSRDEKNVNLATIMYRKTDSYEINNPNPFIIGERLYTKYIEFKVPALYFLLSESKTNYTLTKYLTNELGYISTSKINISFKAIRSTETRNSFKFFKVSELNKVAFPYKDDYNTFVAKIQESSVGDYYEFYGEYNGEIFEDFIAYLNSQQYSDYLAYHEISIQEQVGSSFIQTAKQTIIQTSNWDKSILYRPIILYSSSAVSFVINYILRLVNKIDNTQIIRTSQLISYNVKKYGRYINKLYLGLVPTIDKVYNKVDTDVSATTITLTNNNIINVDNTSVGSIIVNTEYINVFRDRLNISVKFSNIKLNDGIIEELSTNEEIKYQGEAYLGITPFDNYYLFNLYNETNGNEIPLDIINSGSLYINFLDTEHINIKQYTNITNLENNQVVFKIDKENAQKILSFTDNHFYITNKKISEDNQSDETVLYTGLFYDFKNIPSYTLRDDYNKLQEEYNTLLETYNTDIESKDAEILTLKNEIENLTKLSQDYKTVNTKLIELAKDNNISTSTVDNTINEINNTSKKITTQIDRDNIEKLANKKQTSLTKIKTKELKTQIPIK